MASKGNSRYLKRLNAPTYFGVHRKESAYITKPNPGRHKLEKCVPISLAILKLLYARNSGEAAKALKSGAVKLNGKVVKESKYPIGIADVLEVGGHTYKIGINKQGKIKFDRAEKSESESRLCKVVGKHKEAKGKLMLRLHDGSSVADKDNVAINDSVIIKNGKIEERLKLEPGATCAVIDGVHVGVSGKVIEVISGTMHKRKSLIIGSGSEKLETLVGNIMVTR